MLPPGHVAVAYLAAKVAQSLNPQFQNPLFVALTSFFGFFPDLDFFLTFAKAKKLIYEEQFDHRKFITHAPLVYFLIFLVLLWFVKEEQYIAWAFILGTWSHFLIDTFSAGGIAWFAPFIDKHYGLFYENKIHISKTRFFAHWRQFVKSYSKMFSFKAELVLIITALITFFLS